jgi:hypothetical protein
VEAPMTRRPAVSTLLLAALLVAGACVFGA